MFLIYLYAFFFCWYFFSIVVFLFFFASHFPRYTHISSFGVIALLVFSIHLFLYKKNHRVFKILILAGLVIFSGTLRYINLKNIYDHRNSLTSVISKKLKNLEFALPNKSQIVISTEGKIPGCAGWKRSSGYLKYILKRNDING